MTETLIGRQVTDACNLLSSEGIIPIVDRIGPESETSNILRVVKVLDDGAHLVAAAFPAALQE
ncbi:MAG: hypothetical protein IJ242_00755 [Clostridia bacterium]|nr:hypothetical protein [Clostridia bacterium]